MRDERRQAAPQQRLTTREADLVHAELDEDVDEAADLLEVEDLLSRQPDVLLFGHAVAAAQVAPIGDRDPEVSERTLARVAEPGGHFGQAVPASAGSAASARPPSRPRPPLL